MASKKNKSDNQWPVIKSYDSDHLGRIAMPIGGIGTGSVSLNGRGALVDFSKHFNNMRSYALGDEKGLLMASYPYDRPQFPFPYFAELMTGFEYTAAVGMIYEGLDKLALQTVSDIRDRYDGRKRSQFNEAECGHHYARAMASWAAVLAFTGFQYSAVDSAITFTMPEQKAKWFFSTGYSWGTVTIKPGKQSCSVELKVLGGQLSIKSFELKGFGRTEFTKTLKLKAGTKKIFKCRV